MKRPIASITLLVLTIGSVVWLMTPPVEAQSETIIFTAQLLAQNEVPPVAVNPSEANTNGFATITLDVTRTAGVITAASSRFDVSLSGMASNTVIILAHIHEGASNVNGPVRVDSGLSPAAPVPTSGGAAAFTRSNLATTPAIAQAIINNPAGWYFNVHTALSPQGVARGQLVRQQTTPTAGVPTLSEWGAILMGLLIVAVCVFFLVGRGRRSMALAAAAPSPTFAGPMKATDWRLLAKVTLYVEVAIALALIALSANSLDVAGALTSGLVVAFIIHLLIGSARRR
jgi:CHRD domain/IPTL-CTERM motif